MRRIRVVGDGFDPAAEAEALQAGRVDVGATVSFVGYCRGEAGTLAALELEHFPGMAEAEMERIAIEAERRWPLLGVAIVHRHGLVRPGEPIVAVATASAHRAAAFAGAEFIMDFLKTDAPFWKREHRRDQVADPTSPDGWVAAKPGDDAARSRWPEG
ncbi:molybdenum cofactor biosynthesis protein MoaE [Lichenihabitans sp. Uapishka_5]|uniref:molybdenum cofactor biosynthesis protein MoaE n=1 Tax=Lichenihabitans sp. Uapishka_5 TaxID=3037302 RepID=UPI0029E7EB87|nr:molybdenum cofactor biosynthesis protein MoaE [Lichenihabitans sp. Uapishka_5]MDX7951429.1 molybdenum cofactor biosynthesis protein MoaE [Lichenihabitans sp. Uapishka_5]